MKKSKRNISLYLIHREAGENMLELMRNDPRVPLPSSVMLHDNTAMSYVMEGRVTTDHYFANTC